MAREITPLSMTLSDFQGYAPIAGFLNAILRTAKERN